MKILSTGDKIPNFKNCLILITSEEYKNLKSKYLDLEARFLPYDRRNSFDEYLIKVLSFYRVGNGNFSELIFSIDPGSRIGVVVILDNYFLHSHTFYELTPLIEKIKQYHNAIKKLAHGQLNVVFKVGMGVLPLTKRLIKNIFQNVKGWKNLKVYLIDETRSSKIRIPDKKIRISKHETSALILGLRSGIEIKPEKFHTFFNLTGSKKIKTNCLEEMHGLNFKEFKEELGMLAEKIIKGEQAINNTNKFLKNFKNK
ncbi:MAG: hypothetical protein ACTSYC_02075 [Promethearchaeota archaeon]